MTSAARNFFISLIIAAVVLAYIAIKTGHATMAALLSGIVFVVVMTGLSIITIRKEDMNKQRKHSKEDEDDDWEMDMTMVDEPKERPQGSNKL